MSLASGTDSDNFLAQHQRLWEAERESEVLDWDKEEREWVKCVTEGDSQLALLYRMYSHALKVDVDEVVARGSEAFGPGRGCSQIEARYHLRWAFRFLMRNYARVKENHGCRGQNKIIK